MMVLIDFVLKCSTSLLKLISKVLICVDVLSVLIRCSSTNSRAYDKFSSDFINDERYITCDIFISMIASRVECKK